MSLPAIILLSLLGAAFASWLLTAAQGAQPSERQGLLGLLADEGHSLDAALVKLKR